MTFWYIRLRYIQQFFIDAKEEWGWGWGGGDHLAILFSGTWYNRFGCSQVFWPLTLNKELHWTMCWTSLPVSYNELYVRADSLARNREIIRYSTAKLARPRPESPTVTLTWHACKYKVYKLYQKYILTGWGEDVHLVENYCSRLR